MANRFWVGGTGTWNSSNTTSWSTSTGGAGGASVPGTGDMAIFDSSSGGGTVTVDSPNGAGVVTLQQLTMGAFTGTLDFAANDNNVTLSLQLSTSGTGTRTLSMGDGTWTVARSTDFSPLDMSNVSNFTFNANGSTLVIAGTHSNTQDLAFGNLTYNSVRLKRSSSGGIYKMTQGSGANFGAFIVEGGVAFSIQQSQTINYTSLSIADGSLSNFALLTSDNYSNRAILNDSDGGTFSIDYLIAVRINFTGATITANNSINGGSNAGTITFNAPSAGSGGFPVLGGPFT